VRWLDLLGSDFGLAEAHKLYACHDLLLSHKDALSTHLTARWRDLFNANFDVLLYDLTSTYFEVNASDVPKGDKRRHGYSRDKRPDCPQVVIAPVVAPGGLPLAYEMLPGNTVACTTLRMFLARIEQQYGRAGRIWARDRGIPTEAALAKMRASEPPVQHLVGTTIVPHHRWAGADGSPDIAERTLCRTLTSSWNQISIGNPYCSVFATAAPPESHATVRQARPVLHPPLTISGSAPSAMPLFSSSNTLLLILTRITALRRTPCRAIGTKNP
jgi:hypothetical protein